MKNKQYIRWANAWSSKLFGFLLALTLVVPALAAKPVPPKASKPSKKSVPEKSSVIKGSKGQTLMIKQPGRQVLTGKIGKGLAQAPKQAGKSSGRVAVQIPSKGSSKGLALRPSARDLKALARASAPRKGQRDIRLAVRPTWRAPVHQVMPAPAARPVMVGRPSYGQAFGLHGADDPLELRSSVAMVIDQDSNEVLLSKNSNAVLPIASLTKLMSAVVVLEARQNLDEIVTISYEDIDNEKGSGSRLAVGAQLTRVEMLHLALMSSENRAAHALGRHYPGGLDAFVNAMNRKARELGMSDTRYVEPTGLSSLNQSSARDLAALVKHAYRHTLIRELSTSPESEFAVGERVLRYRNTNGLIRDAEWEIGLQKTGYISEAGRCLVMQARMAGRRLIMVFLDSTGKYSRQGDAERVRRWLMTEPTLEGNRPSAQSKVTS